MDLYEITLTLLTASSMLFAIYFAEPAHIKNKHRDDLDVVHHRTKRITLLCVFLLMVIPSIVNGGGYFDNIKKLGILPGYTTTGSLQADLANIAKAIYFILVLYSSTLFQILIGDVAPFDMEDEPIIYALRDYVLAPVSEELIYRGMMVLIADGDAGLMAVCPYLFGIAHVHHGYQMYVIAREPWARVLATVVFQFAYTSVFGMVVLWFYVWSGRNLWCCVVLHVVCNLLGIPSFQVLGLRLRMVKVVYYVLIVVGIVHSYIYLKNM
ncbi:CAAX prenyl protease 2 [Candida viswanathii]|uniref:intramembrane prenyl-peptidase Rce1 n=1 Tax=Candida viswanathii TaxID=5486 RepID=A0A367XPL7_9ASCO|nr:CAAX prenyl protease 2 [Candida viswanathii]